jgi:hypothetical protein
LNRKDWLPIAELIGILAVVASLIFVGMELRQSRAIARTEWTGFHTAEQIGLESLIADHIEIWQGGCLGTELSEPDKGQFARLFGAYYHVALERWIRANIGITGANPLFVSKEFAKNVHRFPGFRDMWAHWKSSRINAAAPTQPGILGFPEEVDSWLPVLLKDEPNPQFDVVLCGLWTS